MSEKTLYSKLHLCRKLGISRSKYYDWKERYGIKNQPVVTPKEFWIPEGEQRVAIEFYKKHYEDGYRAVAFRMIDQNVAFMSSSSLYRILVKHGLMRTKRSKESSKGSGFVQPLRPHEHWHTDISYLKIGSIIYFFISVLDGCSRTVLHWEIRESMKEQDAEMVVQRALEKYPEAKPRLITDNGTQYTAHEFKRFIKRTGLTHVRTAPYYPQSNGKIERFHYTLKSQCVQRSSFISLEDAQKVTQRYIDYYNSERLHSSIGFIAPIDKLNGRDTEIFKERKRKLKEAQERRIDQFAKRAS